MASELTQMVQDGQDGRLVNSLTSGNSNGRQSLKRMKLTWGDIEYQFAINPEDYTQSEPNKATITQTKGGAWIDAWGEGVKELTIKGTTGVYASRGTENVNPDAGYQRWKALRNMIQNAYDAVQDGEKVELMRFYNYTDNEYFYVYPAQGGIELYRSKARPLIYQYTLHLWAVRRLGEPEKQRQVLGDPGKSTRKERRQAEKDEFDAMITQIHDGTGDGASKVNITQLVQYIQEHPHAASSGGQQEKEQ